MDLPINRAQPEHVRNRPSAIIEGSHQRSEATKNPHLKSGQTAIPKRPEEHNHYE